MNTDKDLGGQTLPDLTSSRHPPVEVEYHWASVQEDDLNLGVKVMFTTTIFMTMGLMWVILMSYDGDSAGEELYFYLNHSNYVCSYLTGICFDVNRMLHSCRCSAQEAKQRCYIQQKCWPWRSWNHH
jgi:hypothetical protein